MKNHLKSLIFLTATVTLTIAAGLFAQERDAVQGYVEFPIRIDTVWVSGNDKTRDEVITREIPFTLPAELSLEDVQLIQNRVSNLFLFNRVMVTVVNDGLRNILNIEVAEIYYIYPVPVLFRHDRTWDRISYGFQLAHINFRGRGEYLSVGGWGGFNPAFYVRYSNPWVTKARYTLGLSFYWRKNRNPLVETLDPEPETLSAERADFYENEYSGFTVDGRQLAFGLSLGKRLSHYTRINANLDIRRIRFDEDVPAAFSEYIGYHTYPRAELELRDDRRDLFEYPRQGHYLQWVITRSGFTADQNRYWRLHLDHRKYFRIQEHFSLGVRNLTTLTSDEPNLSDWTFLGYGERVRGYYFDRDNGQNRMLNSVEARISLLPVRYFSWKNAPFLHRYFQQLKYGMSLALFADSGTLWGIRYHLEEEDLIRSNPPLALRNFFSGYGFGIHLHLPYVYLMRFEQAWSDQGDGQFIIEAEVAF